MSVRYTSVMVRRPTVGSGVERRMCGLCNPLVPQFTVPDGIPTNVDRVAAGWDYVGFILPAPPSARRGTLPESLGFNPWGL
jgi:hypothetical protein